MNEEELLYNKLYKEELLYNELYERTKDFGRAQFVREIMRLERENKELKEQLNNPLRGIFAQVTDDDLLRSSGMYYAENKELKEQNEQLKRKFKETNRGLNKVLKSRKVWKNRYYREKDKVDLYKSIIDEIREKLLCYGETFDSEIHQQFQKECLQIIDKVLGKKVE